ncbi:DUF1573 domain-containing protein [bacterium]|nr:DUF1573 domain-containing protein [bacterium]
MAIKNRLKLIIACLSLVAVQCFAQENVPQIYVDAVTHKFGTVSEGFKVKHDFAVKNLGQAPLVLRQLQAGCGCTAALADSSTIAPGGATLIHVTFDTSGFYGYKSKDIRIESNDPRQPVLVLNLEGIVEREINIDPPRLYFGQIRKGSEASQSVKLNLKQNVKILEVTSRSDDFTITKQAEDQLLVSIKSSAKVGLLKSRIVVRTTSTSTPVVSIPIFAEIVGDLVLTPSDISFGMLVNPNSQQLTQRVEIQSASAQAFKIISAKSSLEAVTVMVIKPELEANTHQLLLDVDKNYVGPLSGEVSIQTSLSDPAEQNITLRFYGMITRPNT